MPNVTLVNLLSGIAIAQPKLPLLFLFKPEHYSLEPSLY